MIEFWRGELLFDLELNLFDMWWLDYEFCGDVLSV